MTSPEKTRSPDRTVPTEADATEVDSAPKRKAMTEDQAREILDWFEGTGSEPVDDGIAEMLAMSPEELNEALVEAPAEALTSKEKMREWVKRRSGTR
jgi:hypothetical protein